jgi:diadenosine tetraphosphate (Ap4A) HIT family hydrolase
LAERATVRLMTPFTRWTVARITLACGSRSSSRASFRIDSFVRSGPSRRSSITWRASGRRERWICSRCNRAKGNRDTRDLRRPMRDRDLDCPFCETSIAADTVEANELAFAIRDHYPVTAGHMLVMPRRHVQDGLSMTEAERQAVNDLLRVLSQELRRDDATIEGFTIRENVGAAAGQTVMHAHIHLIPRRAGDVEDPTGGIRGVIPGNARYSEP